jgi:hypothetical protein
MLRLISIFPARRVFAFLSAIATLYLAGFQLAGAVIVEGSFGEKQMVSTDGIAISPKTWDVFVSDRPQSHILNYTSSGSYVEVWGNIPFFKVQTTIIAPTAIAFGQTGKIYILSPSNCNVWKGTTTGVHEGTYGAGGTGNGTFQDPTGVAVDDRNNVYVTDRKFGTVTKFFDNAKFAAKWVVPNLPAPGVPSGPSRGLEDIQAQVVDNQNGPRITYLYVVDGADGCVRKYDTSGNLLLTIGSKGTGPGQLDHPTGVALDANGFIYVADPGNARIVEYSASGAYVNRFDGFSKAGYSLYQPYKLAISRRDGSIYTITERWGIVSRFRLY